MARTRSATVACRWPLIVPDAYATGLVSVTVGGDEQDITGWYVGLGGVVDSGGYGPSWWSYGSGPVVVSWTGGYSTVPPADLKEAMLLAARSHLIGVDGRSGIPDRALSMTNEAGRPGSRRRRPTSTRRASPRRTP